MTAFHAEVEEIVVWKNPAGRRFGHGFSGRTPAAMMDKGGKSD